MTDYTDAINELYDETGNLIDDKENSQEDDYTDAINELYDETGNLIDDKENSQEDDYTDAINELYDETGNLIDDKENSQEDDYTDAINELYDIENNDKQTAYVASKEDGLKNLDLTGIARQNNVSIYEAGIAEKELRAKKAAEMNLKTMQQLGSYDPALKEKFKNDPAKLSIVTALEDAQNIGAFGRFVKDVQQSWGLGVATSEIADLNFKQFMGQELDLDEQNSLNRVNRIQESKINYGSSLYGIPQAVAETAPLMLDAVASKEAILGLYISVLLVIGIKGLSKWKKWLMFGYLLGFFCKTIQFIVYFSIK